MACLVIFRFNGDGHCDKFCYQLLLDGFGLGNMLFRSKHSTIRFSIDDDVNILTPCSKTIHTKFTKQASL